MRLPSLSSRIALMLGVAIALILSGAVALMDNLIEAELTHRFDTSLLSQAHAIAALVEVNAHQPDLDSLRRTPSRVLLGDEHGAFAVDCSGGYRFYSYPIAEVFPPGWPDKVGTRPQYATLHASGQALRAVWFRFDPEDRGGQQASSHGLMACKVLLLQPSQELDEILFTLDVILLIIPLLVVAVAILLTPALVRRGLRPLSALGERMRTIGPSAPEQRVPAVNIRELAPLVDRFNEVLERMQSGMEHERRFAGALAHETRTRLAELRTLIDVECRHPSGQSLTQVLGEIGVIGGELEDTVTGLLLLTRLEAGIETVRSQPVEISAVLEREVEAVADVAARRDIRLQRDASSPPLYVVGDASVFGIVFGNLLRNAVDYAPQGSEVRLSWDAQGVRLENDAPNLDAADVARFGERYWRKPNGESDGVHAGLGLSLAAAAASALGVELRFEIDERRRLSAIVEWSRERVTRGD